VYFCRCAGRGCDRLPRTSDIAKRPTRMREAFDPLLPFGATLARSYNAHGPRLLQERLLHRNRQSRE
jgi:hypothetical protein